MTHSNEELRAMLAEGTQGEWFVHPHQAWVCPASDLDAPICQMRMATDGVSHEAQAAADALLIVGAVNSLPALLERIEALEAGLEPFAAIEPSSMFPANGSEAEEYVVILKGGYGNPAAFTGADLKQARALLSKGTSDV